jgi:hypothetical protein
MVKRYAEISTLALVSLSMAIAIAGTAVLLVAKPVSPNTLVAFEHSLVSEPSNF